MRLLLALGVAAELSLSACGPAVEIEGQLFDPRARLSERNTQSSTTTTRHDQPAPCVSPTIQAITASILTPECARSGCHAGPTPAQGLAFDQDPSVIAARLLEPSTETASGMPLVTPRSIGASYLYLKIALDTPLSGGPMPPSAKLSDCQLSAIRSWIEAL